MVADRLYNLDSFKRQYDALVVLSVCETIPNLEWTESKDSLLQKIDWNNLLGIASILSYSYENNDHLEAALRIAQTCLQQETCSSLQKTGATIILTNLTNQPAIKLAIERKYIDTAYKDDFPLSFKLQSIKADIENSILVKDKLRPLNRFQKNVYEAYENYDILSISAPTSAGKSYILCTVLIEELLNSIKNIVYVVPTRALISQVENDLRKLFSQYEIENANISSVPQIDLDSQKSNVFVFTQERLHWFLHDNNVQIDVLFIDEAHKIEDKNRGILLQQKLEEVVKKNPHIKVFFSSPFTSNPEILLDNVNNNGDKKIPINTQFVSVNQNLIYVTQYPRKPEKWNLLLCTKDKNFELGTVKIKERASSDSKKIMFLCDAISNNISGNIIYANGAAESEKKALLLWDLLPNEEANNQIDDLIKLIKKTIHKDYALAKVLTKRIAFHYGNMPLLIRQEIERLFISGDIKYLICTSTLLEGLNLPAKSIYIYNPTRGKQNPLNQNDFWNLAGRAGRWGKEFSGNIICINPNDWTIKPSPHKHKQKIVRALDIIEKNSGELIDYIISGSPRNEAEKRQDLEFAFGYYYCLFLNNELDEQNDFHIELKKHFKKLKKKIIIPGYIIKKNPGISPIAQQELYNYFKEKENRISEYIPVLPEDEKATDEYLSMIGRIGKTIANYHHGLHHYRAILILNWMRGKPLSLLISNAYKYYQKQNSPKKLPEIIRKVMDDVENFVRFRFTNDSSCYVDILRFFLQQNGKEDLIDRIPPLNLWLEFGVSQKTHLSLLSLGISRNTVIELSEYITSSGMDKQDSIDWLKNQNLEQLGISKIMLEEINRIIELN